MKVLIIDDEPDIRSIARLSLSRIGGVEVVEAGSGAEGVRRASQEEPDVVLLDMMMPVMDGPATLRALQEDPRTSGIPVVFLTAKAMSSEVGRLREIGARGVLTKPFDPMSLYETLKKMMESEPGSFTGPGD